MSKHIKVIALVTNRISATMLLGALDRDGYELGEVALILQRRMAGDWIARCGLVVVFPSKPSLNLLGQINTIWYYRSASRVVKELLSSGDVRDIYISNIDNLISNHIVQVLSAANFRPRVSVVVEGFMNFQEINVNDRAAWRWRVKPTIASLLGLRYIQPVRHLSGAYEDVVDRVFSYSKDGLRAPAVKFVHIPYPSFAPIASVPGKALIVLTGISQWMSEADFAQFKLKFQTWVRGRSFVQIDVKRHPYYSSGGIELGIGEFAYKYDGQGVEDLCPLLDYEVVIGYCTTALAIVKMTRPDVHVLDWGANFYCEAAYHGDTSIVQVLSAVGVEIVNA